MKVKVTQLCPALCDPMDCIGHGILQARILEWKPFPSSPNSGIFFPTQGSNPGLPHCRQILYQLSHKGCPKAVIQFSSVQLLSRVQLCDPMNCSTPGLPVHHQLPEFTQTHVYRVNDAIQPSHPLSSPSPPAPNPSQHQSFPMSQLFT